MFQLNISIFLTLLRMISAPLLVPFFIIHSYSFIHDIWTAVLFLCLGLTDFLDGFLARRYKIETIYGKVLDPLADKFLMYSAFVSLLVVHKIGLCWVIILLGREFFVMGIRQIAYEYNLKVNVSYLGKLKTTVHFLLIVYLLINPANYGINISLFRSIEYILLGASTVFSVWSAGDYFCKVYKNIRM